MTTTGTITHVDADGKSTELGEFQLEPTTPGIVPDRVIDELRSAYRSASDFALAFGEACKAQAEKHGVAPKALRRYISALESDKVKDAEKEAEDLARLIDRGVLE